MDRCVISLLLSLVLVFDVQADTKCNLNAIFKTPQRRDYDQLEIVERSNFLSDDPVPNGRFKNDFSIPNAGVLLRLGDYNNAVRRNNNNINTRITLAGPNHNNYYTPFIQPYHPPIQFPWNLIYPASKTSWFKFIPPSSYVPENRDIPQLFSGPAFEQKPKIIINDPIVFDTSAVQHIALPSQTKEETLPANGLNTMTVIPKIIINNVAKKPIISKAIEPEIEEGGGTLLEIDENLPSPPIKKETTTEEEKPTKIELTGPIAIGDFERPVTFTNPEPTPNVEDESVKCTEQDNFTQIKEDLVVSDEPIIISDSKPKEEPILLDDLKPKECPAVISYAESKIVPADIPTPEEPREIHNIDHPRVLHPVKLSSDIENVEIVGAGNLNISLIDSCPRKIEKYTNAEDLELENLLQKSLVPFINLRTNDKKLLVSYPVVGNVNENIPEHPSAIIVRTVNPEQRYCSKCSFYGNKRPKIDIDYLNIFRGPPITPQAVEVPPTNIYKSSNEYQASSSLASQLVKGAAGASNAIVSGYELLSGSGYYEDPTKKIIYKKPTEITIVTPQITKYNRNRIYLQSSPFVNEPVLSLLQVPRYTIPQYITRPPPKKTNLVDLLKYLIRDILNADKTHTCPYCSEVVKILPTAFREQYNSENPRVVDPYSGPIIKKIPCPYFSVPGQVLRKVWNPKPLQPRCPYCAKYRGELNQLE